MKLGKKKIYYRGAIPVILSLGHEVNLQRRIQYLWRNEDEAFSVELHVTAQQRELGGECDG